MGVELLSERSRRVAAVAQRMRLVQSELVDHPADERRAHLRGEVESVLRTLVPAERKQFLFELMDAFPVFAEASGGMPEGATGGGGGPDRATLDQLAAAQAEIAAIRTELARFNDASFVADRLIELSRRLADDARRVVVKKLSTAGLAEVKTIEVPAGASAPLPPLRPTPPPAPPAAAQPATGISATPGTDLRKALGLAESDAIDAARAGELCGVLCEFSGGLDELVWTAWRQVIAPGSRLSRPGPIKRTLGQFVKGDVQVSRAKVAEDVALLRLITAATIASTSRAGKNFARKHLMKFSVEAIKAATGATGWGKESKFWARYEELANTQTEDLIESEIMQSIGEAARGLAEGKSVSRP